MPNLKEFLYIDSAGDKKTPVDIDDEKAMDHIHMEFDCPICGSYEEVETDSPLPYDETHSCSGCYEEYNLHPVTAVEEMVELNSRQLLEIQLNSIEVFHPIAEENPEETIQMLGRVNTGLLTIMGMVVGSVGTLIVGGHIASEPHSTVIYLGLLCMLIGMGAGIYILSFGDVGELIRSYRRYKNSNVELTYTEYLRHAGNYYHKDPY